MFNEFGRSSRLERVTIREDKNAKEKRQRNNSTIDIDFILTHSLESLIAINEAKYETAKKEFDKFV